jgi:hypothetical protein
MDSEKLRSGEYWSNRYIIDATDLAAAVAIADGIYDIERTVHQPGVTFTKYRVSDMVAGTDNFVVIPKGEPGLLSLTGEPLPLFNVVRVDFGTGSGRPSRKYLRLPLSEGVQANGVLDSVFVTTIRDNYASPLMNHVGFVDVDGEQIISNSVHPEVGMRQLRRGSRRRTTSILP